MSPNSDVRDGALFAAVARRRPGVGLFLPSGSDLGKWPTDVGITPVPTVGRNWTRQWMRDLVGAVEEFDPDLVHVHNEPWAVTSQRLAKGRHPLVVHGAESVIADAPWPYHLRRAGMGRVMARAAGYVSWGVTGLRAIHEAGLPASTPAAVIPASPPDPSVFTQSPMRQPDGTLQIAYVGRLVPQKGVDDLIRAVALAEGSERIGLRIVGGGPQRAQLERLAGTLGVAVRFLGPLQAAAVHDVLVDSDVLVVPSRDTRTCIEQWGRVVVEASMTGRPALVSDSGELPYLVKDGDWVFRQADPSSLARALDRLVEQPELVSLGAEASHLASQRYRPDVLADQLVGFWEGILEHG